MLPHSFNEYLNELELFIHLHPYTITLITVLLLLTLRTYLHRRKTWVDVPVIGYSSPLLSYITAFRMLISCKSMLREGYSKYPIFQIPDLYRWNVFVSGPELLDELMKLPDDVLSQEKAAGEILQTQHLFGPTVFPNPYHAHVVRHQLTRNLAALFPSMVDEMRCAFEDEVPLPPLPSDDWVSVNIQDVLMRAICRISNRTFVGLPLCRNEDYLETNIKYTMDVAIGSQIVRLFPSFLRGLAGRLVTRVHSRNKAAFKHLFPLIEERYAMLAANDGNWDALPADFLTWLMQTAPSPFERSLKNLAYRMLVVNFGAIHTSTVSITWALFYLAAYPAYIPILREEIQEALSSSYEEDGEEGWSKMAMTKCRKLDSFIREVMRVRPMSSGQNARLALKPITLSNGTHLPIGTFISSAMEAQHNDPSLFGPHPEEFDGLRFYNKRMEGEKEENKHQLVFNNSEFHIFGAGRHAWQVALPLNSSLKLA